MAEATSEWLGQQFSKLMHLRPDLATPVLDRAMHEDEAFRWAMVVGAYLDEEINLGKAAELLGVHRLELQRQFVQKGIPVRVGPETIEDARSEAEAWSAWTSQQPER